MPDRHQEDSVGTGTPASDGDVMASVDAGGGVDDRLVIADVSRDEAWLSVHVGEAPSLPDWR